MFNLRSVHNHSQMITETWAMMPEFAGVEKFFAHLTFKVSGAVGHLWGWSTASGRGGCGNTYDSDQ
jgi:hypothetical protein